MKNCFLALVIGLVMSACTSGQAPTTAAVELKRFPLDSLEGVRATTGASFDPKTSADGKGSLRVDAKEPITVPLFEVTDVSIENATLIYQASLHSENLDGLFGDVGRIPGKGEFFSPGLDRPTTGCPKLPARVAPSESTIYRTATTSTSKNGGDVTMLHAGSIPDDFAG